MSMYAKAAPGRCAHVNADSEQPLFCGAVADWSLHYGGIDPQPTCDVHVLGDAKWMATFAHEIRITLAAQAGGAS